MIKHIIDIILSIIAILILSPFLIPIMVILKLTGEGYIIYKQERIGQNGIPFNLLKFATISTVFVKSSKLHNYFFRDLPKHRLFNPL